MAKTYKQPGEVLDYTPSSDVANGAIVLVGTVVGVALAAIPANTTGPVSVWGVHTLPKATGAVSQGAQLYYDATAGNLTTTATDNTAAGKAFSAAASGDATVDIKLNV